MPGTEWVLATILGNGWALGTIQNAEYWISSWKGSGMVSGSSGRVPGPSGTHFGGIWAPKSTQSGAKMAPEPALSTKMWTTWDPYGSW